MKNLLIFIVSLFLLFTAKAQQAQFGIKGGVNLARLHFSDDQISPGSKAGLNFGAFAHIYASKTWALQPELLYSLEGAQKVGDAGTNYNLDYLNVPVLLQYMFNNGFRLEGGPQLGFLLSAKTKSGNVTVANNGFKTTAVSIPLGIGYLTSSGLGVDARYVFGLSNIYEPENPTIQSNVFQLGLFYQLSAHKIHSLVNNLWLQE